MPIVSNTSPLNYLIQIGLADILPELDEQALVPEAVAAELRREEAPKVVREWIANHPSWLSIKPVGIAALHLEKLHAGERDAILLAKQEGVEAVIIDEKDGRRAAINEGLRVIGTLRVLYDASVEGLCDLTDAFARLRQTSFRASPELYQKFLDALKG